MIAVPVSGDLRLHRRAPRVLRPARQAEAPARPRRARHHQLAPDAGRAALSLGVHGEGARLSVAVRARVLTTDPGLLAASRAPGPGSRCCTTRTCATTWRAAISCRCCEEFSTPFAGFYLYYPRRRRDGAGAARAHRQASRRPTRPGQASARYLKPPRRRRGKLYQTTPSARFSTLSSVRRAGDTR